MLDKRIQTLDPKAQKHDQSRTQIDIKAKMIYNSKTKCFPLGPKMYQHFVLSVESFWVICDLKNRINFASKTIVRQQIT